MIRCKLINFLFRVFPIRIFQGFLIEYHFERCPDCQDLLAKREETQPLLVEEEKARELVSLWPGISAQLCKESEVKTRPSFVPKWKWALSAAGLTVLILFGFWSFNRPGSMEMSFEQELDQPFKINYIKVEEMPAGAYVYEPQDSEMIIVWAERLP